METLNKNIRGSFGKKIITYRLIQSSRKNVPLVVFFHGLFSTGLSKRNNLIAKSLVKSGLANCLMLESSRKISYRNFEKMKISYEEYGQTFQGKTFKNELSDAAEVLKNVTTSQKKFGNVRLHFIGSSLGGIIASFLIKKYKKKLDSITLLGSGTIINQFRGTIIDSLPEPKTILANYKEFTGALTLIHGCDDQAIFPSESQKIFGEAQKSRCRKLIFLKDTDHRLIFYKNINREDWYTKFLVDTIKSAFDSKS